jgi:hypothetical protein
MIKGNLDLPYKFTRLSRGNWNIFTVY